ncbi:tRNA(fMet)-specific endonuclease VapC [Acaryochloris thomasi RCC1774]|uniref:tRNA(fMet)-specific endonuclease VapC n=1 Tax=Acaryochloris thomasi RCC1774 TaxID=1764569 RepID=A0A2W1JAK4_9CYAN|nr:type II toxin-antitoxin system VapC family toxin [Acaryochloris thomasi]PZD71026.1 tRNA(fMet)-specific endonuclease VapC [Acaryochloris thomasi RCC1774]
MYILDTNHLSVLDRGGTSAQRLFQQLATINPSEVTTTIISYEEQMRGWLSYLAKAKTIEQQVNGYNQLKRQLANYCTIPVLEFDEAAAQKFHHLKQQYPRLGSMDLKIAAIASVQGAILLTRNSRDFSQITGLSIEDWT